MIRRNDREAVGIRLFGRAVAAIYYMGRLAWQAVRSCFGSGLWVSAKPWLGEEKWKDSK